MKISSFIWLESVVDKLIWKHWVSRDEVQEVFANQPMVRFVENGERPGEDIYSVLGTTDAGRYLIIFFVLKPANRALIISAREMTRRERKRYEEK